MASTEELVKGVNDLLYQGYTLTECAKAINVHRTTLWRWLCQCETWKGVYRKFSVEETCWLILDSIPLRAYAATWGIRMIHDRLRREGYKVSRLMVREALQTLMPNLLQRRQQGRLIRRDYDVFMPMQVWHMDSHDKLAKWGFRIHGAIDGGTHYVVYMIVSLNKLKETIYEPYRHAVDKFGHPLIIRSDYATEHILVREDIERARPNTNAYRSGPSTSNQRIEAFWRQLREKVSHYFEVALDVLSRVEGCLQTSDPWHRTSMVKVFLPALQFAVNDFIEKTWNCHKVRAINERGRNRPSHIPEQAFQANQRQTGQVLPPLYPERSITDRIYGVGTTQDLTTNWIHHTREGAFELTLEDLENEELQRLRDLTYFFYHEKFSLITCKYKFHVALTLECRQCWASRLPFESYFQNKLLEPEALPSSMIALNLLYHTFQNP